MTRLKDEKNQTNQLSIKIKVIQKNHPELDTRNLRSNSFCTWVEAISLDSESSTD